jgi:hypothetical protein
MILLPGLDQHSAEQRTDRPRVRLAEQTQQLLVRPTRVDVLISTGASSGAWASRRPVIPNRSDTVKCRTCLASTACNLAE